LLGAPKLVCWHHTTSAVSASRIRKREPMSIFPTKILLATDGSKEAKLAFASAADLSEKTDSELHVVYVGHMPLVSYESPGATSLDPNLLVRMQEDAEQVARTKLDEQVRQVGQTGEVVEIHARLGRPDAEIVGLADELGAGLIVLGSRGLGPLRRALMGSVSDSVVRHAPCPVLIVRE
jgi:nucleotide-binding universal stress UspA family protein